MKRRFSALLALLLVLCSMAACTPAPAPVDSAASAKPTLDTAATPQPSAETVQPADIVLTGGSVYTMDKAGDVCEAIAIAGNKIVYTGDAGGAEAYIGKETKVIDLAGKTVMPGMIDSHLHSPGSMLTELYSIALDYNKPADTNEAAAKQFLQDNPEVQVAYGSGWGLNQYKGDELKYGPRKERLDAVSNTVPIVLTSYDGHTAWLNTKAFEQFGITKDTIPPEGGTIEKDPKTGELWGTLKEAAMDLIPANTYSDEQYDKAVEEFQKNMSAMGYTAIMTLGGEPVLKQLMPAWEKLEKDGKLQLRVSAAVTIDPNAALDQQLATLKDMSAKYNDGFLKVNTAKFFADGVIEGGTGYLLQPYTAEAGKGDNWKGTFNWDMEKLKQAFAAANKAGFQIHVHSIGDASTKNVLDALDYASSQISGDFRNTITHLQLVDPADIPRFKALNVVASTQMYWHLKEPNWWEVVDLPYLGKDRAEKEYPLNSFIKAGVVVTGSSDCPVTPIPNPFWAIEAGVTRNLNNAAYYGVDDITSMDDPTWLLNKDERASVTDMLKAFTINGAYQLFRDSDTGSIETGKLADLIIVDQDITKIDPVKIDSTAVLLTMVNGQIVYDKLQ